MPTMIKPCDCASAYQDKLYGAGMRVHNEKTKPPDEIRCSVCGKEKKK